MCGLLFSLRIIDKGQKDHDLIFDALAQTVQPRGPDSFNIYVSHLPLDTDHLLEIKLAASVLGLRGEGITSQPVEDDHGVLGWNGQVFRGIQVGLEENDTVKLFERLRDGESPRKVLAGVEGPYACIYLDKRSNELHFQVDPLSRRSLLVHPPDLNTVSDRIIICSARSGDAIVGNLPMRALNGGEGGRVQFEKIIPQGGKMSLEGALTSYTSEEDLSSSWTHVAPINASLPVDADLPSPAIEVDAFLENLTTSVRLRVENIPSVTEGQSRLAILFSGGVDCTLIAAIAHQCLPIDEPIDLVNVGFQRSPEAPNTEAEYRVPDRISGLEAADELRTCCPGRTWRFVEVNVPYGESMQHRQMILDLMYPSATEMDLSLAWPLYFASRGVGTAQTETDGPKLPYTVLPKVYLSGLGADEQLAGYKRHQTAFTRGRWPELISELQMDITRLPTRNLSRDDRLISSHARDARFPYLDLTFINYLSSLPVWLKCDPTVTGGDKLLLRLAARKLGLLHTSERVKRAMQFGTRSAKVGGRGRGAKKGDLPVHQFE